MVEVLELMAEQNERMLLVLEQISSKLESLSALEVAVQQIHDELQWHKELTFASRLIESVDNVRDEIQASSVP